MPKRKQRQDKDGLFKRSDSKYWWASYIDADGKRVRRSTRTTDRKEAEALLAMWRLESHRTQQWGEQPMRTFEELMVAYLQATADKKSADKDRQRTKRLRKHFGGKVMNHISAADVQEYKSMRRTDGVRPSTINRELTLLSTAINYANREWEWELPNPVRGRKFKEPEGRVRWIEHEEAQRLIEAAREECRSPYLADLITLALNTGCRSEELLGLQWRRVDLKLGLIFLDAEHTKTAKRRSVPLNQTAREAVLSRARFRAEWCPDSSWVFCRKNGQRLTTVKKAFATACSKAGITDFRFHDLRHTCAAWLVTAGVPLAEVRDLLGHSSIVMTERYAHLAPDNVRAAVAELDKSRFSHVQRKTG